MTCWQSCKVARLQLDSVNKKEGRTAGDIFCRAVDFSRMCAISHEQNFFLQLALKMIEWHTERQLDTSSIYSSSSSSSFGCYTSIYRTVKGRTDVVTDFQRLSSWPSRIGRTAPFFPSASCCCGCKVDLIQHSCTSKACMRGCMRALAFRKTEWRMRRKSCRWWRSFCKFAVDMKHARTSAELRSACKIKWLNRLHALKLEKTHAFPSLLLIRIVHIQRIECRSQSLSAC